LVTVLSLPLFLHSFPALAADADKDAKAGADAQGRAGAKKPAVRIIVLNGTYVDYPSTSDVDPMSLLLGGLEKPGSFFVLCEKLGEQATVDELQHVILVLTFSTIPHNLAPLFDMTLTHLL